MQTTRNLDEALRELAYQLREDIPRLVERGFAVAYEETPDFFLHDDDPDFIEASRRSYVQQLGFIFDGLERGRDLEGRESPPHAIEEARLSASLDIKLSSLLLGYRVGQRLIFDEAMDIANRSITDQNLRAAVLRVTSRWLFAYVDWLTPRMTEVYERERDLLMRDKERRKRQLVRDILEGQPVDAGKLGYLLDDRDHLAVIAWGHQPERAMIALHDATGMAYLTVTGTESTGWCWLSAQSITPATLRKIRAFEPPEGSRIAYGEPSHGTDGFRLSYRQAWSAYRLSRSSAEPVTWHSDVALLALTLHDTTLAREFVIRELGALAERNERSELLRDTLVAYFASGENAAAAAAALFVHNRTVLYRLRSIEERLGRSILERREELGVALRLAPHVLRDDG